MKNITTVDTADTNTPTISATNRNDYVLELYSMEAMRSDSSPLYMLYSDMRIHAAMAGQSQAPITVHVGCRL